MMARKSRALMCVIGCLSVAIVVMDGRSMCMVMISRVIWGAMHVKRERLRLQ